MSLNERISKILEYSGMTPSEFADAVEVQRSSISHITSGRNKPSLEFVTKIKNRFPEIQWEWLINGAGEMRQENETPKSEEKKTPNLPDLFSLINDEDFGKVAKAEPEPQPKPRELHKKTQTKPAPAIEESQQSEKWDTEATDVPKLAERKSIKRIAIFFSDGTFESYEP